MNEFTKEELDVLLQEMNIVIHRINKEGVLQISPHYVELRDKIKSMIDSYCDQNCMHQIDKVAKRCKLCKLPSSSIPCIGGWL